MSPIESQIKNKPSSETPPLETPPLEKSIAEASESKSNLSAILDKDACFEGKLTFSGTVQIGGQFKGEVFTKDTLIINRGAKVEGEIHVGTVIISGDVNANICAQNRVVMYTPANFKGTVTTPCLRIDEGVVFEGASYMPDKSKL